MLTDDETLSQAAEAVLADVTALAKTETRSLLTSAEYRPVTISADSSEQRSNIFEAPADTPFRTACPETGAHRQDRTTIAPDRAGSSGESSSSRTGRGS